MKILIMAVGSYGDVLPLLGLAKALHRRSFEVTFFTNGHFADLIRQTGLEFVPLDSAEAYDAFADNPALWHPHKGWRLIMKQLASSKLQEAYRILCRHVTSTRNHLDQFHLGFGSQTGAGNAWDPSCHNPSLPRSLSFRPFPSQDA
jgi:UDP:flavonoid glycosyltransferase YjiC (YdhE family)